MGTVVVTVTERIRITADRLGLMLDRLMLDRLQVVLRRSRHGIHVIPSSDATLSKLAKDPYATVQLSEEQAACLEEIESAAKHATEPAEPAATA